MNTLKNKWASLKAATVESAAETKKSVKGFNALVTGGACALAAIAVVPSVFAIGDIATSFSTVFSEIYSALMIVTTIVAVVLIAICLLLRMLSKNPKTADEATAWIKRIIIAWFCMMLLSVFLKYATSIIGTAGADTATPWD